jgi:DNA-binding transcriptional MerR regulator
MKKEFSQMAFNFPMEAEPQAPPKNGLSAHQGEENNALVLSKEQEHVVREEGRRAGVVVRIKSLKRSPEQTEQHATPLTGSGIMATTDPAKALTPPFPAPVKTPEQVFVQTSIPLGDVDLPVVKAEIPAPVEKAPERTLFEEVQDPAFREAAPKPALAEEAPESALAEAAPDPALAEEAPDPTFVEETSEPALAEEAYDPHVAEVSPEPPLVEEAATPAEASREPAPAEEEPLPKRSSPRPATAKAKPAPAEKIKSKRGRKSLKEVAAEADLIDIPADEVLFSKQYYTMGEVAGMFRVNQSLLRFWETEFSILQPRKNRKGDRYFRPVDIKNLHLIYHLLRQRKYTIEGAKEFLRKNKKAEQRFEAIQRLQQIKAFLLELKAQL